MTLGGPLWHQEDNFNNHCICLLDNIKGKYLNYRTCGFREDLNIFFNTKSRHLSGRAIVCQMGDYLNIICKGMLDNARRQMSRLYAIWC